MLARSGVPCDAGGWAFEVKFDGMRAQLRLDDGKLCLRSRPGRDCTDAFPELAPLSGEFRRRRLLLAEALGSAEDATAEVREVAHGIRPSVLTRGGLRAAVDALMSRVGLPVDVDISSERLSRDIEPSAYFIVAEALTNVVKHARATHATVWAAADDGILTVEVRDDGVGGANPEGHGLMGIADRVDALGGRLRIESTDGDGTVLSVRLPLSTR